MEFDIGSFPFARLDTTYITRLHLWRDDRLTMLEHLILVCAGRPVDEDADTVDSRLVVDLVMSVFPSLRRVVDVETQEEWRGHATDVLVNALVRNWETEHIVLRLP